MNTAQQAKFRHPVQEFIWAASTWDIAALIQDLDDGKLRPKADVLDRAFIEAYAQGVLALKRTHPVGHKVHSLFVSVDTDHARALPMDALKEPVIVLATGKGRGFLSLNGETKPGHVLADGNHRIARAFYDDIPELPVYYLSAAQSRKYKLR